MMMIMIIIIVVVVVVIVEQLVESELAGESEVLRENMPHCHFFLDKSHLI
jgi:hypothetical protein